MTYAPAFTIVSKPSSFENAFKRTFKPGVLQVVHVTGNSDVAKLPDGVTPGHSPYQDWLYAARNPASADGPSANNYVGREGSTIEMWDPATHAAWSNGDLKSPRLDLPGVKYLANLRARGINANKGCYREIELSGYPGTYDPTDAQIEVCAYLAAKDSLATGIDIVLHETMLTHGYINTIDRQNCAFRPAIREARMRQICDRALEIRALLEGDNVAQLPITDQTPLLISATTKTRYYDLDGTTILATRDNGYGEHLSPYGYGTGYRAIVAKLTTGGPDRLVLVKNIDTSRPAPSADCGDAVAAEHERTRLAALAAVEAIP